MKWVARWTLCALLLAGLTPPLAAAIWFVNSAGNSLWRDGSNWDLGRVPYASDLAIIDTAALCLVDGGPVAACARLLVGYDAAVTADLVIDGGEVVVNGDVGLAYYPGSLGGHIEVQAGSFLQTGGSCFVPQSIYGRYSTIDVSGGQFQANIMRLGYQGEGGCLRVGPAGQYTSLAGTYVGDYAHGQLVIDGGEASCGSELILGAAAIAAQGLYGWGEVFVQGGTLEVQGQLTLGAVAGARGDIELDGGDVTVGTDAYIGYAGDGSLTLHGGTFATLGDCYLAYGSGSGPVDFRATDGAVSARAGTVGYQGAVTVDLAGATLTATDVWIWGYYAGSSVSGVVTSSTIVSSPRLYLGRAGGVDLVFEDCTLDCTDGIIGLGWGDSKTQQVTVEIRNSAVSAGRLTMGYGGAATLALVNCTTTLTSTTYGMGCELGYAAGGIAHLIVDGGVLQVANRLSVGTVWNAEGRLEVRAGEVHASELTLNNGLSTVDIQQGRIVLPNNQVELVEAWVRDGWIVAYGGDPRARICVDYNQTTPGKTTIRAAMTAAELAYAPAPAHDGVWRLDDGEVLLTWQPGLGAVYHRVYFGDDYEAVAAADEQAPEFQATTPSGQESWTPGAPAAGRSYFWRVDEFDGDDWHKGAIWQFHLTEGQPTVYVCDLRTVANLGKERAYDMQHTAACLQGLVNRAGPVLFLAFQNEDMVWLDRLTSAQGMCAYWRVTELSWEQLWSTLGGVARGVVCYSTDADSGVCSTSLAATTAAGCDELIAVRKDTSAGSVLQYLTQDPTGPGYPVQLDLTGRFSGTGTVWQTGRPSSGSAKCDAYLWALEAYLKTGRVDPGLYYYTLDLFGLKVNAGPRCQLMTLDHAVQRRAFCFELSPWGDEAPNDDPTQPLGTDLTTYCEILDELNRLNDYARVIKRCGFLSWQYKYTNYGGGSHSGVSTEWETVRLNSAFNSYLEGVNTVANASFYSQLGDRLERNGRLVQNPAPQYADLVARGLIDSQGQVVSGNYILLGQGDYDSANALYLIGNGLYGDAARGAVPGSWAVNPNLVDRLPVLFDYLYRNKSAQDVFVAWDSGAGYLNPTQLYGARSPSGYDDIIKPWRMHCSDYYRRLDYSISAWQLNGIAGTMNHAIIDIYAPFSGDGCGFENGDIWGPGVHDNIGIVRLSAPYNPGAANLINYPQGVNFAFYRTVAMAPGTIQAIQAEIAGGHNQRLLDAYTFYYLLRHHYGGSNAYRATWVADDVPPTMAAWGQYPVTITVRNDGWDDWSAPAGYGFGYAWTRPGTEPIDADFEDNPVTPLPTSIPAGATGTLAVTLPAPPADGAWELHYDLHRQQVGWFRAAYSLPWKTAVSVVGAADVNDDQVVDWADMVEVAGDWLADNRQAVDVTPGQLVGYWAFDEGVGVTAQDSSGWGNHGAVTGATWTTGRYGGALDFHGDGSAVTVADSAVLSVGDGDYTLCAWVSPDILPQEESGLVTKVHDSRDKEFALSCFGSQLQLDVENFSNNGVIKTVSGAVQVGAWQHVAVAFSAAVKQAHFYVNGQLVGVAEHSVGWLPDALDDALVIGRWGGTYGAKGFDGRIDEVRVYDYCLTPAELVAVRDNQAPPRRWRWQCPIYPYGDVDGDCRIDLMDHAEMRRHWKAAD